MQFAKLPTDLCERLIPQVCRKNFTISELVLTMIKNDNFRIQLFNLEIDATNTTEPDSLSFNNDETSLDILNFSNYQMINEFERLITDGWISIKSLISTNISRFKFLLKYSKRCYCYNGSIYYSAEIFEYVVDLNLLRMNVCLNDLQCLDYCVKSKKVIVKMNMMVEDALKYLVNMIIMRRPFKQYQSDLNVVHGLDLADKNSVDDMVIKYKEFQDFLKIYEITVTSFKIVLYLHLNGSVYDSFDCLKKIISIDDYAKKIKKIILYESSGKRCYFKFDCIKKFKYLEILDIECLINVDYKVLGSLKSMEYLKEIYFKYANADYLWMNQCLPDCIERIKIFQTDDHQYFNSIFNVPLSLKILEIEMIKDRKEFQFDRFDFTNAVNLSHIHLTIPIYEDYFSNAAPNVIKIQGLKEVPNNLKYLIYNDYNFDERIYQRNLTFSGIEMDGIYSNINNYDNDLTLIRI